MKEARSRPTEFVVSLLPGFLKVPWLLRAVSALAKISVYGLLRLNLSAARIKHFECADRGGPTRLNPELFEYFLHVLFHGGLGDAKNRRDVRVGLALGEPEQRLGR